MNMVKIPCKIQTLQHYPYPQNNQSKAEFMRTFQFTEAAYKENMNTPIEIEEHIR